MTVILSSLENSISKFISLSYVFASFSTDLKFLLSLWSWNCLTMPKRGSLLVVMWWAAFIFVVLYSWVISWKPLPPLSGGRYSNGLDSWWCFPLNLQIIFLAFLSGSWSDLMGQSLDHIWYCRTGIAKQFVTLTLRGTVKDDDQMIWSRRTNSSLASSKTFFSSCPKFSNFPRNL